MKRWRKRFFASTRGRVVQLLRRGAASVRDLAEELDVTDNAVRAHLTTLERDRLVEQAGKRPGVRKPETLYALTSEAEHFFPKAYHLLLNELLGELERRLSPAELDDVLGATGRRLAARPPQGGQETPLRVRVEKALETLKQMGGLAEMEETAGGFVIRGNSCPLAAAVDEHPAVCRLAEALLSSTVGTPVREACRRNGTTQCVFHVARA